MNLLQYCILLNNNKEKVWNTTKNSNQGSPKSCPGGPTETKKALNESWGLFLEYYVNNFNPRKL